MRETSKVDELDVRLVERLVANGRESNRSLAEALGVNQATIAARLKRLATMQIMRVVAVTDLAAFGFGFFAFGLIRTAGRPVLEIADDLATLPELISVNATSGCCDIVARVAARDRLDLARVFGDSIMSVPGVSEARCEWAVDIPHYTPRYAVLGGGSIAAPPLPLAEGLDDIDLKVIEALQKDARTSNRSIAALLGVSEGTIRSRIRHLQDDGFIRIQAICDFLAFGLSTSAFVGIRVAGGRTNQVGQALAKLDDVQIIARTVGTFDYMLLVFAESRSQYRKLLYERIPQLDGISSAQTFEIDVPVKHEFTWARIS